MKKQPKITAQTRENLIRAYWALTLRGNAGRVTVADLVKKAGYNRSTFYEYFRDLTDVLDKLEDALLERVKQEVMASLQKYREEDVVERVAKVFQTNAEYVGPLLNGKGGPRFIIKLKAVMGTPLMEHFGLPAEDVQSGYITEFGLSAIIGTLSYWYNSRMAICAAEIVTMIRSMLSKGVLQEIEKLAGSNKS